MTGTVTSARITVGDGVPFEVNVDEIQDLADDERFRDEMGDALGSARGARDDAGDDRAPQVSVPIPGEFIGENGETVEFLPAADLERLMLHLANACTELTHVRDLNIVCLWRGAGGKTGGKPVIGKCQKPSGLLKHFSEADFVVWLAADHCRSLILTQRQIEACLYRELCHVWVDEDGKLALLSPDINAFTSELRRYQLWEDDWRRVASVMKQQKLFA